MSLCVIQINRCRLSLVEANLLNSYPDITAWSGHVFQFMKPFRKLRHQFILCLFIHLLPSSSLFFFVPLLSLPIKTAKLKIPIPPSDWRTMLTSRLPSSTTALHEVLGQKNFKWACAPLCHEESILACYVTSVIFIENILIFSHPLFLKISIIL